MSDTTVGRIISAPMIEAGIEVCIRNWLPYYLGRVLEQAGRNIHGLPDPTDLVRIPDTDQWQPGQVSMAVVASPGTISVTREADSYSATWGVQASVIVDLNDRLQTREAAQFFAAALGAAISQKGVALVDTDGVTWVTDDDGQQLVLPGSTVRWLGEFPRRLTGEGEPLVMAGDAQFAVIVTDARSVWGGPDLPPLDDDGLPTVRDAVVPEGAVTFVPAVTNRAVAYDEDL